MYNNKNKSLRSVLDLMAKSKVYAPFTRFTSGVGLIFTLHRITPEEPEGFSPNGILQITPEYLESVIQAVRVADYDIISISEVKSRLVNKEFSRRFVCFTIDDGYLDNLIHALPVFQRNNVPFTVYINSGLPEYSTILWWQHLEDIIKENQQVYFSLLGQQHTYNTVTKDEKNKTYDAIYAALRQMSHSAQQDVITQLLEDYQIDPTDLCRELSMSWKQVQTLAESGLLTIGAHTLNHHALAKLDEQQVREEIEEGQRVMEQRIGVRAEHFAYPYGDSGSAAGREFNIARKLGLETAVTVRKGVLFPEHADYLHALPRVSLNGDFQKSAYVPLFLSGFPFALFNRFKRLDVS